LAISNLRQVASHLQRRQVTFDQQPDSGEVNRAVIMPQPAAEAADFEPGNVVAKLGRGRAQLAVASPMIIKDYLTAKVT
jgi:hypothetical protein